MRMWKKQSFVHCALMVVIKNGMTTLENSNFKKKETNYYNKSMRLLYIPATQTRACLPEKWKCVASKALLRKPGIVRTWTLQRTVWRAWLQEETSEPLECPGPGWSESHNHQFSPLWSALVKVFRGLLVAKSHRNFFLFCSMSH